MNIYMDDVRDSPYIGWRVVRDVPECAVLISTGEVEHLSLDHDMGACYECKSKGLHEGDMTSPETTFMNWCPHHLDGTKLIRWMITTGHWPKYKPMVHSANPVGAARMRAMIDKFFPGAENDQVLHEMPRS